MSEGKENSGIKRIKKGSPKAAEPALHTHISKKGRQKTFSTTDVGGRYRERSRDEMG